MFEKLKKLIFDESVELGPDEDLYETEIDSLESNTNLVKTQRMQRPVEPKEDVIAETKESEFVFKRIDV